MRHRWLGGVVVCALALGVGMARADGAKADGAKADGCGGAISAEEALQAEDARYAAQTGGDFAAMARLFGDDLIYTHSSGRTDGKASYIALQRSQSVVYRHMRRDHVTVRLYGCVAIITGSGHFDVAVNGRDGAVDLLFHSIWAKRDGAMQFVSWQSTPAATP